MIWPLECKTDVRDIVEVDGVCGVVDSVSCVNDGAICSETMFNNKEPNVETNYPFQETCSTPTLVNRNGDVSEHNVRLKNDNIKLQISYINTDSVRRYENQVTNVKEIGDYQNSTEQDDFDFCRPDTSFKNEILSPNVVIYQRHQKVLAFGKRYHVCVLYKDSEPALSHVMNLVQELEDLGFICYYRCRDFIPGQRYPKTIVNCLEQSMKFIIIINNAFIESEKCQYELDLALEECFSRGEDGNMSVIIPCRLEPCEIPRTLKPFKVLDIYNNRKLWWNRMVDAIELDSDYVIKKQFDSKTKSASDLELIGANFLEKLQRAKMEEVVNFLVKPIAYDLFHFLNQCNDFRFFFSAMKTLGIEIKDSTVYVLMKTLKDFVSRPYYIAHIFKENMPKLKEKVSQVGLIVYDMDDLMLRQHSDEVKQFNEIVRVAMNADETYDHFGRGVVYSIEGIPKSRSIRNECRMLIHDAVVEPPVTKPKYPQFDTYEARIQTFRYYPLSIKPTKEQLAEAGYFCADDGVVFRCFYCNGADWDFKPDEEPWVRHAKYYYHCPFVLSTKGQAYIDECRFDKAIRQGIYNPDFEDINSRLCSYASWNTENAPTPTILAEAGFYFTHIEDKVACHMCGHGLRNWDIHDDPWYKHALWSPNCKFLKEHKSKDFILKARQDSSKFELADNRCILSYSLRKREVKTKRSQSDMKEFQAP